MVDDLAGLGDGEDASAETSAAPALDIEALKAQLKEELASEYNSRIAGLQTALNKKDAEAKAAREKARELEMSGLTQDERDALEWQQKDEQIAALARDNQLLRLTGKYPKLVPLYQQMMGAPDLESQLELLSTQFNAEAPAQTPVSEPEPEIPGIDPNNPPAQLPSGVTSSGVVMTDAIADRILGSIRRLPGR